MVAAVARDTGEEWTGFKMGSDSARVISWSGKVHKIAPAYCASVAWFSGLIQSFHVWKMERREKLPYGAKFGLDWRGDVFSGENLG